MAAPHRVGEVDIEAARPQLTMEFAGPSRQSESVGDGLRDDAKASRGDEFGSIDPTEMSIDDRKHRGLGERPVVVLDVLEQLVVESDHHHAGAELVR